ncbi:hypothetical protein V2J09_011779 [Rumex salicifolius]
MTTNVNVSSNMNLHFPNNADLVGWYVELSFVSRIWTYLIILGIVFFIIVIILNYLGVCNEEHDIEEFHTATHDIFVPTRFEQRDREHLIPKKPAKLTYETVEEDDPEAGSSSGSSDELYEGKICVICYDEPRNCFFVPCGHCATCYDCAERVMEEDSRACPICRRLIHKLRKLYNADV